MPLFRKKVQIITARNGGKAGHDQREGRQREAFWDKIDMAEFHQQCPSADPRQKQSSGRRRQYSSGSTVANSSRRQDSQSSDLAGFFSPVSPSELEAIRRDQKSQKRRPKRRQMARVLDSQSDNDSSAH